MYDDHTFSCLQALGPSPGWRRLDVGTGPDGTVAALDRRTRMLDTFAHPSNLDTLSCGFAWTSTSWSTARRGDRCRILRWWTCR